MFIPTVNPIHKCAATMSPQRRSTTTLCCGSSTRSASASHKSAFKFGSTNTPRLTPSSSRQRSKSKRHTLPVEVNTHLSDNQFFCLYLHQHTVKVNSKMLFNNCSITNIVSGLFRLLKVIEEQELYILSMDPNSRQFQTIIN